MKLIDTIAAISTPFGKGGVAMIRISGYEAFDIASKIFRPANGASVLSLEHAKMTYGEIFSPFDNSISIDDGMAVVFKAPRSFTGENTVEIYCHGGTLVTRKVLSAALAAGARAAEAGEFTRRAFVSGKMSLGSAEALGNLLEANTDSQLRLARSGMRGNLDAKTESIYKSLRDVMTSIFAAIDFPDEDLSELSREQMIAMLDSTLAQIKALSSTYRTGRAVTEGIQTVICGRTNAGKSSVYNKILGYDAAIVTDIEGTTRDILREQATLGNTTLLLCDTAGIRSTDDKVESIGIDRALDEISTAELILAVFDGSSELSADDLELIERLSVIKQRCIALINKADLESNAKTQEKIANSFERYIVISTATGAGFDELARTVDEMFIDGSIDIDNDAVITGARQYAALEQAAVALSASLAELRAGTALDLCCIGIETAMSQIGQVDGREIGEDVVAEIFSKFCVGK
ncbi:MAG: tRNA uridine-5-carboxymethylaminomethyl(34) synthesis GTPase MnmE [Ruminococcaceae bacterium]|nr:tRNA uridine-5-carboxymethylaminomethyl(34) synthesis GTPase MnmE [Oscillospiraceae bacterium]